MKNSKMTFQIRDHMNLDYSNLYLNQLHSINQNKEKTVNINKISNLPLSLVLSWSQENKINIEEVTRNSGYIAKWICPVCGGTYEKCVRNKKEDNSDCPYCNNSKLLEGYNDLASTHPSLAKQWSSSNDFKPTQVMRRFIFEANWICPVCHGEYKQFICEKTEDNTDCPYCNNKIPLAGFNNLATTHPNLAKLLSPNNLLNANQIVYSPKQNVFYDKFKWICPICHGEYKKALNEKKEDNTDCPYCNNIKPLKGLNTLYDKYPELLKEWAYEENTLLNIFPDKILPSSSQQVWWKCPNCNRKYLLSVSLKVEKYDRNFESCIYCSGYRMKEFHYF